MVAMATCGNHEHAHHSPSGDPVPQSHWSDALPTPAPSPEGCTNSDGPSDWATDHCPMLFVHGRMVRHRSNGLSMSQVSVSDMDPPGPDLLPQTPWPTSAPDPHPPISTHRPQPPPGEADRWHYVMSMCWYGVGGKVMYISLAGWIGGAGPIQGTFWLTESVRSILNGGCR